MTRLDTWGASALSLVVLGAAAVLFAASVSGCASSSKPKVESSNPTYTDSDVPQARKRASTRLQLAVLYYQDSKSTYALDEIKQAIQADPSWFEPYWMRGLIQMQMDDNADAEASFQKALEINPHAPDLQHNYAVLLCKMHRAEEGLRKFDEILADPTYGQRAKTLLEQGNCLLSVGKKTQAEASFQHSLELDASNSTTGFRLASLLFERNENVRAQFFIRRINNSEAATAETLWLGVKIEQRLGNTDAMQQLAVQLRKRFGSSREATAFERGAFNE